MTIPAFGLGTFRLKDDVVIASVKRALELGYRAVDTAQIYDNEAAVGQAIAESGVPRNELYITTKIWIENLSKEKLIPSLKESLKKLRTDYVDLTLSTGHLQVMRYLLRNSCRRCSKQNSRG